jgi:hypothetical protein
MGISVIGSAGYLVPQTRFRAKRNREHNKRDAECNTFFEKNAKKRNWSDSAMVNQRAFVIQNFGLCLKNLPPQ